MNWFPNKEEDEFPVPKLNKLLDGGLLSFFCSLFPKRLIMLLFEEFFIKGLLSFNNDCWFWLFLFWLDWNRDLSFIEEETIVCWLNNPSFLE